MEQIRVLGTGRKTTYTVEFDGGLTVSDLPRSALTSYRSMQTACALKGRYVTIHQMEELAHRQANADAIRSRWLMLVSGAIRRGIEAADQDSVADDADDAEDPVATKNGTQLHRKPRR
jgi:hypothetical protein